MTIIKQNDYLASDNYTDVQSLNKIKQASKDDKDAALYNIAKKFESMMIQMMLKSMRDANKVFAQDNPFNSNSTETYQQMYDDQLSLHMNKGNGMGIADVLVRQLKGQYPVNEALNQENAKAINSDDKKISSNTAEQKPNAANILSAEKNAALIKSAENQLSAEKDNTVKPADNAFILPEAKRTTEHSISHSIERLALLGRAEKTMEQQVPTVNKVEKEIEFDGSIDSFVDQLYPFAKETADKLGIDPSVILAQAALETGWGKSVNKHADNSSSFNLFNIKANKLWQGDKTNQHTTEFINGNKQAINDDFRAYQSVRESFDDYHAFITGNKRYSEALTVKDSENYVKAIHKAGYATDPQYSDKILQIANSRAMKNAINKAQL